MHNAGVRIFGAQMTLGRLRSNAAGVPCVQVPPVRARQAGALLQRQLSEAGRPRGSGRVIILLTAGTYWKLIMILLGTRRVGRRAPSIDAPTISVT